MPTPNPRTIVSLLAAAATIFGGLVPASALAGDAEAGKIVYTTYCIVCHGETGKGDGPVGIALDPRPRDFAAGVFKFDTDSDGATGTDTDLTTAITQGGAAWGSPLMAPWPTLSEAEVANVIAYIRTLKQ